MDRSIKLALAGAILVIPALLLVFGGVLQSGFGITRVNDALNFDLFLFHPGVIMGGLLLAFALNLLPVVRINYQDGVFISTVTVRDRLLNLGLIGGIGFMAAIIFLYLLAENFQIFQRIF
ncbi:MAG: hypothetical protein R3264_08135 [Anaerolineae bacterium]|nr:hypothetical protein [Anaerolineae bacterium]